MPTKYDDPKLALLARSAERVHELPAGILDAIRLAGEKSNSDQVSPKGAKGVYQFMPATWAAYADPGTDPTDPFEATNAAARYLADTLNRYKGNTLAAIADYNGGPKAAKKFLATGDAGNKETNAYLDRARKFMGPDAPKAAPVVPSVLKTPVAPIESSDPFNFPGIGFTPLAEAPKLDMFGAPVDDGLDMPLTMSDVMLSDNQTNDSRLEDTIRSTVEDVFNG